jgi:T4 RnlA family RNA ligase
MILIPTYKEALNLTISNPELYKVSKIEVSKGFLLHTFDYLPGSDKKNVAGLGLEMRGLSFLENQNNNTISRYLSLRKFYNLNEREDTSLKNLKDKKINSITLKEDGSLISFLNINGKAIAKTRNGMKSVSTILSNKFVEENHLNDSIIKMINKGYYPFFEITGLDNIVVIIYPKTSLTLLQIRDKNGNYLDRKEIFKLCEEVGFPKKFIVKEFPLTSLEDLHKLSKTVTNIEGWVVMFDSQNMVKIKTRWYLDEKEKLYSDNFKWKNLLEAIIYNKLDEDDLESLPSYKKTFIKSMQSKILIKFENYLEKFIEDFKEIKKNCYLSNNENQAIRLAMHMLGCDTLLIKEFVKKEFLSMYKKESDCRKLFMKTKD